MLSFLGQSIDEEPEFQVEKDARTPPVTENPIRTIELLVGDNSPKGVEGAVQVNGKYYAVNTTGPLARWNREAFKLLFQLFQMTVTDVPRSGVPSITIAK